LSCLYLDNSKHQLTNNKQYPNSNPQNPKHQLGPNTDIERKNRISYPKLILGLEGSYRCFCSLDIGIWDLFVICDFTGPPFKGKVYRIKVYHGAMQTMQ
jgi:hypothetical protein